GSLWWGRTEYPIPAFDTSVDTFVTYSASGQENATASQFPNEQYDNSGTLTTMTNNRWANLFFWIEPDEHIIMVYGREQFVTEAQAENEGVPSSSLPTRISETGILVGRFTFKEGTNTATIATNFPAGIFNSAGVTDHGNLAGLTDDDHTQYILVDGTRAFTGLQTFDAGFISSASSTVSAPLHVLTLNASTTSVVDDLTILGTCIGCGGGGGDPFAWTPVLDGNATTTRLLFQDGFISTASSTVSAQLHVSNNLSASSTITVDGRAYFGGNVGIGTVSPQELLHVGVGTDASDITATDLLVTRAGPSSLSVRDSTNDVETFLFASSVGGIMGTVTNDPLNIKTNNASAIFIDASQ
ncbi:hypothetical protein LCGC14_3045260, partial [marine sediment metagenome]